MEHFKYSVCRDCFEVLEYGYLERDLNPEMEEHVLACTEILSTRHKGRFYYEQGKDEEFSPKPCDCCGSYWAGSRYEYTWITE